MSEQVLEHKENVSIDAKPFEYAMSLIGGKWKLNILFWLWRAEVMRYSQLKRNLTGITHKMLSTQLKELQQENIIERHEYPQVPPKVEYYLTSKGESLIPIVMSMCAWGKENIKQN